MTTFEPILLTGGTGYLGRHLRDLFAECRYDVTVLSRSESNVDLHPNERLVVGDITEKDTIDISNHRSVVHLAAFTDVNAAVENPAKAWRVNADGTANLLERTLDSAADRFLYVSTSRVYGRPEYFPIDESHPTNPLDPYGSSKLAGDRLAYSYGEAFDLSVLIARPFNSFGRGLPGSNVAAVIADQVKNSDAVELLELSSARDFLHVSDTVAGIARILTHGQPGEVYNIGRGEDVTIGTFAETAVDVSGRDIPVRTKGENQRSDDVSISRTVADSSKLRDLGWTPDHSLEEGLRILLED